MTADPQRREGQQDAKDTDMEALGEGWRPDWLTNWLLGAGAAGVLAGGGVESLERHVADFGAAVEANRQQQELWAAIEERQRRICHRIGGG